MLALAFATPACGKSEPDAVGFGIFQIGKSTPADGYVCRPEGDQTYCSNNPSPLIAGHKTQTDLYFKGHGDDAPLIEILVGIWSCDPGAVSAELAAKMGEPTEKAEKRALWRLKKMTVIALLPRDKDLCTLHFLDHSEKARIAELYPPSAPASATP